MPGNYLNTQEVAKLLGCKRQKIKYLREAGLLRMFKLGKGYVTTPEEYKKFNELCFRYSLDIGNADKIILAGQFVRKNADAGTSAK